MRTYEIKYKGQRVGIVRAKTIEKATNSYEMELLIREYGPNLSIKLMPKSKHPNPGKQGWIPCKAVKLVKGKLLIKK